MRMMKFSIKILGIACLVIMFSSIGVHAQTVTPSTVPTLEPTTTATETPVPTPEPTETTTPAPTATEIPTSTAYPTYTPYPTNTPYPPYPSNTPNPTYTPNPTNTPNPTYTPPPTPTTPPTYTPYPTYTTEPTYTPYPTNTPYPTPTGEAVPAPYVDFVSNIPESGIVDYEDLLSQGFSVYVTKKTQRFTVKLSVAGLNFYYPTWQEGSDFTQFLQQPEHLGLNSYHMWTFPFLAYLVADIEFTVCLYDFNMQTGWTEVDCKDYMIHFVSDPPPTPERPCRVGEALVNITNIPVMNDGTKDAYNKQILFCLQDEDKRNFVGVYHRYVQPNWPYGSWWAAWRMESGDYGCWEEWNIWEAGSLNGGSAQFRISWNNNSIAITHTGTGDTQVLPAHNIPAFNMASQSSQCANWGWDSPAHLELLDWQCTEEGPPDPC